MVYKSSKIVINLHWTSRKMTNKKPRVIVRLTGGLGNQLFQYALGRSIEINCGADVSYNTSSIALKNNRRFMLSLFNTKVATTDEPFPQTLAERLLSALSGKTYIREKYLQYMSSLFSRIKKSGTFYLEGYWQTEKYFQNIREQLLSEMTLKNPYSKSAQAFSEAIARATSVALHVRRGDYVTNPGAHATHGICDLEYYHKAVETITEKVPDSHFFVFSDDIAWVKENLELDSACTTYVSDSGMLDEEELLLMSECVHTIIANSSFSWWAAWLNRNPDKIIIAPKHWFALAALHSENLVPSSWLQL